MNDNVKVIGIYNIEDNIDVHLIELMINEKPSLIDVGMFTQEIANVSKDEWQVAYDEHYLNSTGEKVIGDYLNLTQDDIAPTRLAFFLYFIDFTLPLLSQFGEIKLISPLELPARLKQIIVYEEND